MKYLTILMTILITGCSGVQVSTQDGKEVYYPITEAQAKEIAGRSLSDVFPDLPVTAVEFPNPGYQVELDNGLDRHLFISYYIHQDKQEPQGYYFKVWHDGSYGSGPSKAKRVFKNVDSKVNNLATPIALIAD